MKFTIKQLNKALIESRSAKAHSVHDFDFDFVKLRMHDGCVEAFSIHPIGKYDQWLPVAGIAISGPGYTIDIKSFCIAER